MAITPVKVMHISDGVFGGKLDSHVFYAQYMNLMRADFIGKMMSATALNKTSFIGSGSAIYTKNFIPQIEDYKDGSSPMREPVATRIEVKLSEKMTAKYEFEDFDLATVEASEFTSKAASGLAASTMAMWDAEFGKFAVAVGIMNKKYIKLSTFSSTSDKNQMEMDNLTFNDALEDLITIFDREKLGSNKAQVISLMNNKAKYRRIKGFGVTGGNIIPEKFISGELYGFNGWTIATHGFIGKKIAKGTSWSLDRDYDFTNVECISVNTEALAFPVGLNTIKDVRNQITGNDGIVAKISFGRGVLYEDLVQLFVKDYPTLQEINDAIKLVKGISTNTYSNDGEARSAGYKLKGDSRVLNDEPETFSVDLDRMKSLEEENKALKESLINITSKLEDQTSQDQTSQETKKK